MNHQESFCLAMSGHHHKQLHKHLFPGGGKEAVAIALCGRSKNQRRESLLVQEIFPIPYEDCRIRSPNRVTWRPEAMIPALTRAMKDNLAVVKIHSHPTGYEWFSGTDDISDQELFGSIYGWLDTNEPQASLIMLPNGTMVGRVIYPGLLGHAIQEFRVAGDDFLFMRTPGSRATLDDYGLRIAQAFGDATYQNLKSLRIGVVGCSGTGSVVIEQLARYCVGELVIVDPDEIEAKNLNRILNSTHEDAEKKVNKTQMLKRAVEKMGLGTKIIAMPYDLLNREVIQELASCDVLFGCMDSVDGRHILNKLASYYLIPFIDLGVRIDADGVGGVERVCGVVHTILPCGSSLMSRGVYDSKDLSDAFMRRASPETYAQREAEGYIRGARVEQPAVISVNMQIAATAINELLARLHPYRVDSNDNFAHRRIVISDPAASSDEIDGTPCPAFRRYVGLGDQEPPLGLIDLQASPGNAKC